MLCDRFVDSSLAYQGYARGIGMEEVWDINRFAVHRTMPDITLWFDIDPEAGLERIRANRSRSEPAGHGAAGISSSGPAGL